MKSPEEKKNRQVPTRMTMLQYEIIRRKAKQRDMAISSFMVDAAVHGDKQINPYQLMQIQNWANMAADACQASDPQMAQQIRKEANNLWSLLK